MTDTQELNKHTHFNFGFVGGLVLGGALVLLLGTKKGKEVVDQILNEGEEAIGDYLEKNPKVEQKLEKKTAVVASRVSRFFHRRGKPLT
jgi:hypothetical protein